MSTYSVRSYHLNIDEGDSAIHYLLSGNSISRCVLIDGGLGYYGPKVVASFLNNNAVKSLKRSDSHPKSSFDAVVVTHWDNDHAQGLYSVFVQDLRRAAKEFVANKKNKIKTADDLLQAVDAMKIRSSLIQYDDDFTGNPETRFYAPYWSRSESNLRSKLTKVPAVQLGKVERNGETLLTILVDVELPGAMLVDDVPDEGDGVNQAGKTPRPKPKPKPKNKKVFVRIPAMLMAEKGEAMIGLDLFTGDRVLNIDHASARSPAHISKYLATATAGKKRPVMFCIGCDGVVCYKPEEGVREEMVWADDKGNCDISSMRMGYLRLLPANKCKSKELKMAEPVRSMAVDGTTTANNLASVASMIIWPDATGANVSHYFAGDVGDEIEERLLRWSTIPSNDGKIRIPAPIKAMKLSHHGSKLSTPLMMLFAWNPDFIIASNGMRAQFNHCSWEILVIIWAWTLATRSRLMYNPLCTTNYPIYLCKHWLKQSKQCTHVSPGSIASLGQPKGGDFLRLISRVENRIFDITGNEAEKREKVAQFLANNWNSYSLVAAKSFGVDTNSPENGIIESESQQVRFFELKQTHEGVDIDTFCGSSTERALRVNDTDLLSTKSAAVSPSTQPGDDPPQPLPGRENQGTFWRPAHPNRNLRPTGMICGDKAFEIIKRDAGIDEDLQSNPSAPVAGDYASFFDSCGRGLARFNAVGPAVVDGPATAVASDADVREEPVGGRLSVQPKNLDLFLGELYTAAMVFKEKPPLEGAEDLELTALHSSDETLQWLMSCVGQVDDDECSLSALAYLHGIDEVRIKKFELKTCLKYAWEDSSQCPDLPFFQDAITFSSAKNSYAFDLSESSPWPNVPVSEVPDPVGTEPDTVGMALVMCLSLDDEPALAGVAVSGTDILSMLDFEPKGCLDWLAKLSSFELDTAKGKRNALWFSPGALYETTMRLCFKTAEPSLLQEIKKLVLEVAGIKDEFLRVANSNLIVKKSWSSNQRQNVEIRRSVTFLTNVELTYNKVAIPFQTALSLSEGSFEWVLNFRKNGEKFETLFSFISQIFGAGDTPNVTTYLPGADKIALRRIVVKSWKDGEALVKTLDVVFQVSFASMTMLCSFRYDYRESKGSFFISGRLFPENRPDVLGEDFQWIPYLPEYEPWTALSVGPAPNSDGILEDVAPSEIGNLTDAYNALAGEDLASCPVSLELVGLQFALSEREVCFSAMIMNKPSSSARVPVLRLLGAALSLKYDVDAKEVSHFSIETGLALTARDPGIPSALWNLKLEYDIYDLVWTLRGGVSGLRGSLLYSLFNDNCNVEMTQLLSNIVLDLDLEYKYSNGVGSSFKATGTLHLGDLELGATYKHNGGDDWSLSASLQVGEYKTLLGDVIESICGTSVLSTLPDCVKDIEIKPVSNQSLTSLEAVKLSEGFLVLVRLQITDETSVAFYQYQASREDPNQHTTEPVKRMLLFAVDELPSAKDVPLIGDLPQPFDEMLFMWVGSEGQGWTFEEVSTVNKQLAAAGNYPLIPFKEPPKGSTATMDDAKTKVAVKDGLHFCLLLGGETRLDYIFGRKKGPATSMDEDLTADGTTTPMSLSLGPAKITGLGFDFDINTQKLKLSLDGTVQLGPIELTLLGFSVLFDMKGFTLRNLKTLKPGFDLEGLGVAFDKDPITIAGLFEHQVTKTSDLYLGGAIVGFKQWKFEAGGYYGTSTENDGSKQQMMIKLTDESFKAFLAYVRVSGPVATIGYAEIRGLVGGFGYNTSVKFPNIENVQDFPFLAEPEDTPSKALTAMLKSGWFSNQKGQNWVAAGLTVLAFETLTVQAVVVVEWGSGVKLGIFGLATAEMPKQIPQKFAVVQLGLVATVDFDGGVMKVDGQLTPASYVLDPSCHLTGGFALYSWFGPGEQQGDWAFTIGGYHSAYKKPASYPSPPRLGISWSYDSNISITGQAYFAITPKACMGGGSLHVTLSLGPLYAYLDAYADFLINYRPFSYRATAGVVVGVHFTLDLWLVTIPINVDLGAIITLMGPPLRGNVHVDFYVFGFDIAFGSQTAASIDKISLPEFYHLVLQSAPKENVHSPSTADKETELGPPLLLNCISGLIPPSGDKEAEPGKPNKWVVRGAVFAFSISCKFAVVTAEVKTRLSRDPMQDPWTHPVENKAKDKVYSKPMNLVSPMGESLLQVEIEPPAREPPKLGTREEPPSPVWNMVTAEYSNLPTALWGQYDEREDPTRSLSSSSSLLDGSTGSTAELMSGLTLYGPKELRSKDLLQKFDVGKAMGQLATPKRAFPKLDDVHSEWRPQESRDPDDQYELLRTTWGGRSNDTITQLAKYVSDLGLSGWNWDKAQSGRIGVPTNLVTDMSKWYIEAPQLTVG